MTATFYVGDAIEVMSKLPEKSVDLVLTSPPFLALRSYLPADHPDKALEGGSQATPGAFIDWLIDVVEACDRVLAPHGSLCLELGDTYAGSGGAGGDYAENGLREGQPLFRQVASREHRPEREGTGADGGARLVLPSGGRGWPLAKSLSLIPELFRLTLVYGTNPLTGRQTERWRLRNVVRWVRPNPPVGALGDKFRPATSELMVFCKSAKRYFDLDAVRVATTEEPKQRIHALANGRDDRNDWNAERLTHNPAGAPPLDWWNIPPGGFNGAHYAVFPPELCVKPIKAMCPEKVCRVCGEPSRRIVENLTDDRRPNAPTAAELGGYLRAHLNQPVGVVASALGIPETQASHYFRTDPGARLPDPETWQRLRTVLDLGDEYDEAMQVVPADYAGADYGNRTIPGRLSGGAPANGMKKVVATGWTDCGCPEIYDEPARATSQREGAQLKTSAGLSGERLTQPQQPSSRWRPGLVLDPFAGSGTTLMVATGHGRDAIGIDLDERNFDLALQRVGPFILERAR